MVVRRGQNQERPRRGQSGSEVGVRPTVWQGIWVAIGAILEVGTEGRLWGQSHS